MSSRSLVFLGAWIRKDVVRNLRWQIWWILESNGGENAAKFQWFRSSNTPVYQLLRERTNKRQSRKPHQRKYGKHWVAPPDGHLCQSAQSSRSSGGHDCRIASWSESCGETRCIRSAGWTRNSHTTSSRRIASQWRVTGKPIAKIWGTIGEIVRRPEVIQTMLRSMFEISRSWTILLCSSVTKRNRKSIFMPRIYDASRFKRNSNQRMDPKQCTIWPSLGHKMFAILINHFALKSKFNLSSKIKPNHGLKLWTTSTSLSEKPCRFKRKRKLRWNPLQTQDQYWNRYQRVAGTLLLWNRDNGLT